MHSLESLTVKVVKGKGFPAIHIKYKYTYFFDNDEQQKYGLNSRFELEWSK